MKAGTLLRLAARSLLHRRVRGYLAICTISAMVSTILVTRALTVGQTARTTELLDTFQARYLFVYDSLATTFPSSELSDRVRELSAAGMVAHYDFLIAFIVDDEKDTLPLLVCSLPDPLRRRWGRCTRWWRAMSRARDCAR